MNEGKSGTANDKNTGGGAGPARLHSVDLPPTDTELAQAFRDEMDEACKTVCDILDRAAASGMRITFNVAPDGFCRHQANIEIIKRLA